jgi:hypothetical protein
MLHLRGALHGLIAFLFSLDHMLLELEPVGASSFVPAEHKLEEVSELS